MKLFLSELEQVSSHLESMSRESSWNHIKLEPKSSALLRELVYHINELVDLHHNTCLELFSYMYLPQRTLKEYGILHKMLKFIKKLHQCRVAFCVLKNLDDPFKGFNIRIDSQKGARTAIDYFADQGYHIIRILEDERKVLSIEEVKSIGDAL